MFFHQGLLLRAAGAHQRDRRPAACARSPSIPTLFDYGKNKLDTVEAARPRLRRLPRALPAEHAEVQGRGARVPRRELLPRARQGPASTACRRAGSRSTPRLASGEEFPRFTEFWIERPAPQRERARRSTRCSTRRASTGAYRFVVQPGAETVVDVHGAPVPARERRQARHRAADQHVLLRREPARAATTTGPKCTTPTACRSQPATGEWIWRPLVNPKRLLVTSFAIDEPARLRPDAARPRLRPATRTSKRATSCVRARGSSRAASGAPAGSSSCRSRRPTRPTTTSSRTGCPTSAPAPSEPLDFEYRLHWQKDDGDASAARVGRRRRGAGAATAQARRQHRLRRRLRRARR